MSIPAADDPIRKEARRRINAVRKKRWWIWAILGGSSRRGGLLCGTLRLALIGGFGVAFALLVYLLIACLCILPLARRINASTAQATAHFNAAIASMESEAAKEQSTGNPSSGDFTAQDIASLARVTFTLEPPTTNPWEIFRHGQELRAIIWAAPKPTPAAKQSPAPANTEPVKAGSTVASERPESMSRIWEGPIFVLRPIVFPLFKVEGRLSPQALTKILVTTTADRRKTLEMENPSDKAVARYGDLLRGESASQPSMENDLADVANHGLFEWTRRLSGPIQLWIVTFFGCFLISIWVRRYVDYAFDRWLQRQKKIREYFQFESLADEGGSLSTDLLPEFHKFDEGIDELQRASVVDGYFLDSVTFHMQREAIAAVCQGGHQKFEAVRSMLDSSAKAYSERFYSSTSLPRFLLWALPTAGFVGTTVGIGSALGNANLLQSVDVATREAGRSIISTSISVAFDTTFVGLILSMVGMLILHMIQEQQDLYVHEVASEVNGTMTTAGLFGGFIPPGTAAPITRRAERLQEGRTVIWPYILICLAVLAAGFLIAFPDLIKEVTTWVSRFVTQWFQSGH